MGQSPAIHHDSQIASRLTDAGNARIDSVETEGPATELGRFRPLSRESLWRGITQTNDSPVASAKSTLNNDPVAVPTQTWEANAAGEPATRVVVADDDVLLREGLSSLFERSGFEVVGQAGNGVELVDLVRSTTPDLATIDIRMPPTHSTEGLEAAQVIRGELPDTALVLLSAHVEVDEAMRLLAGGDRLGYLLKSRVTDVAEFIDTMRKVVAGASVVDPALVQELVEAPRRRDPLDVLSPREREVLALMAEGSSNAGIAGRIFVSEGTVEKHVRSILIKLDLPESPSDHRRVLAVLRFLEDR